MLQKVVATRACNVNGLSAALLISSTAILSVILGVFGAYCAICGLLSALNPSRPNVLRALVPHQSPASGASRASSSSLRVASDFEKLAVALHRCPDKPPANP